MKITFAITAAVLALTAATPSNASTLFSSAALSPGAIAYPASLGFSANSGVAQSGVLTFTLVGTNTVDGDNSYEDDFQALLNAASLYTGTFNLGGGGNNVTFTNPSGATLSNYVLNGTNGGGSIDFSIPVALIAGANNFAFAYTTPGVSNGGSQGLGDEGFNITNVVLTGAVPEPATWAMLILGFGVVGGAVRTRRRATLQAA